jgi:small subunit ribosomal protein S20
LSSERAARVSQRRGMRNRSVRRGLRTARTTASRSLAKKDSATSHVIQNTLRLIDTAASKGIMHRNKAARLKSRLHRRLNAAQVSTNEEVS